MKAANETEEFRYRIRNKNIVIHDKVNAGITVFRDDGLYSNVIVKYSDNVREFILITEEAIKKGKKNIIIAEEQKGIDDVIYITCLPWISFTSAMHPVKLDSDDSIPRIAWGKYFEEFRKYKLPLSVQVNHSLMDGIHVVKFYEKLQNIFNFPGKYF